MKLKRCFVDEYGNIWKDSTLIKESRCLKKEPFNLSSVSMEEALRWKLVNLRDYMNHYKRVAEADCTIPIILRSDGYPMDGWHRIIKAKVEVLQLKARRFIDNPAPDFRPDHLTCQKIAEQTDNLLLAGQFGLMR